MKPEIFRSKSAPAITAKRKAKQTGKPWAVVSIDGNYGREIVPVPESYLETDEFNAFDGHVMTLFYPDGAEG